MRRVPAPASAAPDGARAPALVAMLVVTACVAAPVEPPPEFARPEFIRFGMPVTELGERLSGRCEQLSIRPIDPPFLPDLEERQDQIDCQGLEFFGRRRDAEFVLGDRTLRTVWILTTAEEEPALLAAMKAVYGEPTHVTADYFAFTDHHAALRRDIPEVFFYADSMAEVYQRFFDDLIAAPD